MTIDLILNELSVDPIAADIPSARQRMATMLDVIVRARRFGPPVAVRFSTDPNAVLLGPDYPIARWRNDREVDRELRRAWTALAVRHPYLTEEEVGRLTEELEVTDIRHQERLAQGLGLAFLLDTTGLSVASSAVWDTPELGLLLRTLRPDGDFDETNVRVRHASLPVHVDHHEDWFRDRQHSIQDWHDLWLRRAELFSSLIFCEQVWKQLREFDAGDLAFAPICKKLFELDAYFVSWKDGQFDPTPLNHATPESSTTLKQYAAERTFMCPDGTSRVFSWHVRYTPRAGRIHFFPDPQTRKGIIGYIGQKLRTVNYPT